MGLQDEVDEMVTLDAFCNADAMIGVESVVYMAKGLPEQTISVPVYRDPPMPDMATGQVARRIRITVATSQIDAVTCPGDKVRIAFDRGGTAREHAVKQILSQDAGAWMLLLG